MRACPSCRGTAASLKFDKDGVGFHRCANCDLLFMDADAAADSEAFYERDYFVWVLQDFESTRRIKSRTFGRWLERIERFVRPGRLLDVGCAFGFMLEAAGQRGWQPRGVERSTYARQALERRLGPGMAVADLADLKTDRPFDAVTLFDVIEHIYDFDATIARLRALLAPNGIIAISTPNFRSLCARVMGRHWFHIKPLEHPMLFSPRSIAAMLSRHDFKIVHLGRAVKWMTFTYVATHARRYHFPLNGLIRAALTPLTRFLPNMIFPVYSGEMLVIARRRKSCDSAPRP